MKLPGSPVTTCKSYTGEGKGRAGTAKQGLCGLLEGIWGPGEGLGHCPVKWPSLEGGLPRAWPLMSCVSESFITVFWRNKNTG